MNYRGLIEKLEGVREEAEQIRASQTQSHSSTPNSTIRSSYSSESMAEGNGRGKQLVPKAPIAGTEKMINPKYEWYDPNSNHEKGKSSIVMFGLILFLCQAIFLIGAYFLYR